MKEIKDIIELQTHDQAKKLSFATRYLVQINFTFDLSVTSNCFSGSSHFCVRIGEIKAFCNQLTKMHSLLVGSAKLCDNDSDAFVIFTSSDFWPCHSARSGWWVTRRALCAVRVPNRPNLYFAIC